MTDVVEYTYNSSDNTNDLLLKADGAAVDLSSVTRMILYDVDGGWSIDESDSASDSVFDRDTGVTGKVIIALGDQGITAGRYRCRLKVYDPTNTSGIVWGHKGIVLHVR
jgi:hypothetical protein